MTDFKRILSLYFTQKLSYREIASITGCGKTKISDFIKRFESCDKNELSYPLDSKMTNERIEELLYNRRGLPTRLASFREPNYCKVIAATKHKGQTLKRQWRIYQAEETVDDCKPYSYRQFCKRILAWTDNQETVSHIIREPGQNIELDYAGMNLFLRSRFSRDLETKVTVFIATLSYSNYFYAEGLTCCNEENWIRACNNAFKFFGGITPIVTPDNCKVAVNHNRDWIEPEINEAFQNMANCYGFSIMPAQVRSPRWKPNIENTVGIVTRDILVEMQEMAFFTLEEFNEELFDRVIERNNQNFQGLDFSRYSKFMNEESMTLMPLPAENFQITQRKVAKVSNDLSVTFDKNKYTMLRKYVGSIVEVQASESKVWIYNQHGDLLKEYPRSYGKYVWVYDEETTPRSKSDYSYWTPDYFLNKATSVGPATRKVIEKVLASRPSPNQAFRACYGILCFRGKYGNDALELCCNHAIEAGRPNYTFVKDFIQQCKQNQESENKPELNAKDKTELNTTPDLSSEMKYKVPDSKYSLKKLIAVQEEKYDKN